jgi:hypothetical protein
VTVYPKEDTSGRPNVIRLVPEEIGEGSVRLTRVSRWVSPEDGEHYWHIPRSAELVDGVARVRFWCGGSRWVAMERFHAEPFPDALRCGTCEGRAAGYERRDGLIFSPRSPFDAPKFCPAFLSPDEKRCPFCGSKGRWVRNYCHYDQAQHRCGDGIASATPCPRHGWKFTRRQSNGLICFGKPWGNPDCGFLVMPPNKDGAA